MLLFCVHSSKDVEKCPLASFLVKKTYLGMLTGQSSSHLTCITVHTNQKITLQEQIPDVDATCNGPPLYLEQEINPN